MNVETEDRVYLQYYRDVAQTTMPANAEAERELFQNYYATKNEEARRRIIEGGLRFVIKIARQYHRGNMDYLKTLIAAGNVGLLTAVDRYMPWVINCRRCKKPNYVPHPKHQRCANCQRPLRSQDAQLYTTRFLTYAAWWISEAIRTEMYESSLIHVPAYRQKEQYRSQNPEKNVNINYVNYEDALEETSTNGEDAVMFSYARELLHKLLGSKRTSSSLTMDFGKTPRLCAKSHRSLGSVPNAFVKSKWTRCPTYVSVCLGTRKNSAT